MEQIVLKAEPRSDGRHALRELRATGRIPTVVYGAHIEPQPIMVDGKDLHRVLVAAGTGLITLELGSGGPLKVLAREIQRHTLKHTPLHVDFMAVSLTERLRMNVRVVPEGTAPILAQQDMVLVRNLDTVEIECLPENIPQNLLAHMGSLKSVDDSIYVRDLVAPEGVRILTDGDHVLFSVTISRAAEAEEAEETAPVAEVEVVAKGKKEEEE